MSKIKVQCAHCDRAAACAGVYEASEGAVSPACNVCCGHGNEDGWCEPIENFILTSAGLLKSPVPAPSQDAADSSCEDHRTPHCPRCEPERPAVQSDGAPSAFIEPTAKRDKDWTLAYVGAVGFAGLTVPLPHDLGVPLIPEAVEACIEALLRAHSATLREQVAKLARNGFERQHVQFPQESTWRPVYQALREILALVEPGGTVWAPCGDAHEKGPTTP